MAFRNQGYSNTLGKTSLNQRLESYKKWQEAGETRKKNRASVFEGVKPDKDGKIGDVESGSVDSSWLETLGYNHETGEAMATFRNTAGTFYYKMRWQTFLTWINAPSKGKWMHDHWLAISKGNYRREIGTTPSDTVDSVVKSKNAARVQRTKGSRARQAARHMQDVMG